MKKFGPGDIFTNVVRAYPKVEFFLNSGSIFFNMTQMSSGSVDGYEYSQIHLNVVSGSN